MELERKVDPRCLRPRERNRFQNPREWWWYGGPEGHKPGRYAAQVLWNNFPPAWSHSGCFRKARRGPDGSHNWDRCMETAPRPPAMDRSFQCGKDCRERRRTLRSARRDSESDRAGFSNHLARRIRSHWSDIGG